jgi:P27 family predicted phage terminase small subunit
MRGRKPTINHGRRPNTTADAPALPDWLSPDARQEWSRVLGLIATAGALSRPDADVLSAYCETLVLFRRAIAMLHRDGITFVSDDRMIKRHPAVGIASDARKDLVRLAAELGMTPVSRQRLNVGVEQVDDLQDFLNGGMKLAK